jgi:hypothetical protein
MTWIPVCTVERPSKCEGYAWGTYLLKTWPIPRPGNSTQDCRYEVAPHFFPAPLELTEKRRNKGLVEVDKVEKLGALVEDQVDTLRKLLWYDRGLLDGKTRKEASSVHPVMLLLLTITISIVVRNWRWPYGNQNPNLRTNGREVWESF